MIENIFLDNEHCPKCQGPLFQRKPKKDKHITVEKEDTIRFWCRCGYYKDEVIKTEKK